MTPTDKGQSALHLAVENKKCESLVEFIAQDKKLSEMVNKQDDDGNTPLHMAASSGKVKLIETLCAGEATVRILPNNNGHNYKDIKKEFEDRIRRAVKDKEQQQNEERGKRLVEATDNFQNGLLVMTSLITTVTFTAAFTIPGGYNGDGPGKGLATLAGRRVFLVFLIANTISMCSSMVAAVVLIISSMMLSDKWRLTTLKAAIGALGISILTMLITFTAGIWLVTGSHHRSLAIATVVLTSSASCILTVAAAVGFTMFGSGNKEDEKADGDKIP